MRLKTLLLVALAALGLGASQAKPAYAATGAAYTVSPVIPSNQRSAVSSYFDLVVKPGAVQPLTVAVTNATATTRHLRLSLTHAYTQDNGEIGYKPNGPKDASAQYRLDQLGAASQKVTLAAKQTKRVTVKVTIPKGGFTGVILGGLYIVDEGESAGASANGVQFSNRYATLVGVQLQTSTGAINRVKPALKLQAVGAGIANNRPGVLATIQNPTPTYWGKMLVTAKVYRRNSDTVVMRRTASNYATAPNSHFDFGITQSTGLAPGDYTLDLLVTGPHGRWHWRRNFSILTEQAQRINKKLALKTPFTMPWWGWVLIGLGALLVIGLLWWLIVLLRRRKKDEDD
ncbi:DUF916 and DUF3324 domain-containing protein [Lacticaseibacillus kribbianus]|uniref:DUF916 and DUF3324 domain-containing protein n=1 Tax=Lacticaseibacillus kribbianus TaxID=2926292 RepID=UPI001CD7B0A5|nr:DUF916 and DUF3324 domain-containing protein [Lacticaseibacillus kribbianus]